MSRLLDHRKTPPLTHTLQKSSPSNQPEKTFRMWDPPTTIPLLSWLTSPLIETSKSPEAIKNQLDLTPMTRRQTCQEAQTT